MSISPNPDRRARYAAAIAEGFRAFDADTTSDAYLDAELLDAVVAVADAEQAELRSVVARLAQMADHWEQQLPEVIRTPAVVSAIRAALEPAVSVVPPATNQTALRERIAAEARTVRLRLGPNAIAMAQRGEPIILNLNEADDLADAVLAVLPEPTDRAAVLREAAEAVAKEREKTDVNVAVYPRWDARQKLALSAAESLLRRLAAEAPTATKPDDYERTTGHLITCLSVAMGPEGADPDCPCAAGVGQDGAQPQEVCGKNRSVDGTEYRPCALAPGHPEAYCQSADGMHLFLAMGMGDPQ